MLAGVTSMRACRPAGTGPFRVAHLRPGDPYELSDGHAIVAEPAGPRHGRQNLLGAAVVATDPAVAAAGVDVGFALDERTMRAPDVAVGDLPDQSGYVVGAPSLALEYVEAGADEADLARKVAELIAAGTRVVWVVRLGGERRVEVHGPRHPVRVKRAGESLEAPGILRNPVPVDALYDDAAAREVVLRNLLQRHGHASLDEVRREGRAQGRAAALLRVLELRGLALRGEQRRTIDSCRNPETLDLWLARALTATEADEVFR